MNRKVWDKIVSASAAVIAVAMIVLGGFAIYGGNFGRDNVQSRLEPQNITFPPFDAMTPEEQQEVGTFAGQQVTTGAQAEAFSRYIGGHLAFGERWQDVLGDQCRSTRRGSGPRHRGGAPGQGRHPVQG